ncbi:GSCOCG00004819001-RA-CDS [Cotesia congregata]|nr:GSCOCG00004819001-RA-CDS [Cotesia congregata]
MVSLQFALSLYHRRIVSTAFKVSSSKGVINESGFSFWFSGFEISVTSESDIGSGIGNSRTSIIFESVSNSWISRFEQSIPSDSGVDFRCNISDFKLLLSVDLRNSSFVTSIVSSRLAKSVIIGIFRNFFIGVVLVFKFIVYEFRIFAGFIEYYHVMCVKYLLCNTF